MRVFNSDRQDTHHSRSFSVPLYDRRKKMEKKLIAQEIWKENNKILAKKKRAKPLRSSPIIPPIEKKKISDVFLTALKKEKQRQKKRVRYATRIKPAARYIAEMKKEVKKYGDMQHPEYKVVNMYRFNAFRNHLLMRSSEGLTAGEAWVLLRKCWLGFKVAQQVGNERGMRFYARGIQKYVYLLEEVPIDFSNIGLKPYKEIF